MKYSILLYFAAIGLFACQNNNQGVNNVIKKDSTASVAPAKRTEVQNGESIERYPNGVIKMQGIMKDGKRDGLWKSFYNNGSPWSETTFSNGKKNGKTTTWYTNDIKRYEGFYTDDKESGLWTYWNEKGDVINKKNYDN